jgi:hypothetical protein
MVGDAPLLPPDRSEHWRRQGPKERPFFGSMLNDMVRGRLGSCLHGRWIAPGREARLIPARGNRLGHQRHRFNTSIVRQDAAQSSVTGPLVEETRNERRNSLSDPTWAYHTYGCHFRRRASLANRRATCSGWYDRTEADPIGAGGVK